jgi:hypothetical protein
VVWTGVDADPMNLQALVMDGDELNDRLYITSFLACNPTLLLIHIRGQVSTAPETIIHNGQKLKVFPSLWCYIFEMQPRFWNGGNWVQKEHLGDNSPFLGLNQPIIGRVDNVYGPHPPHLPLLRSGCVYISHNSLDFAPSQADWIRLPLAVPVSHTVKDI